MIYFKNKYKNNYLDDQVFLKKYINHTMNVIYLKFCKLLKISINIQIKQTKIYESGKKDLVLAHSDTLNIKTVNFLCTKN